MENKELILREFEGVWKLDQKAKGRSIQSYSFDFFTSGFNCGKKLVDFCEHCGSVKVYCRECEKCYNRGAHNEQIRALESLEKELRFLAEKPKKLINDHKVTCACGKCKLPIFLRYDEILEKIKELKK